MAAEYSTVVKRFFPYLICLIILLLDSCKHENRNGIYLIYKERPLFNALFMANPTFGTSEQVQSRLSSALMGKKFQFEFDKDFIMLKSPGSAYNELLLNKKKGYEGIEYYYGERIIGNATMRFSLMTNDTPYLIMAVDCLFPYDAPLIIPVQFGGAILAAPPKDQKARVLFCLKKTE